MSKNFCLICGNERKLLETEWLSTLRGNKPAFTRTHCKECGTYYHSDKTGLVQIMLRDKEGKTGFTLREVEIPEGCLLIFKDKRVKEKHSARKFKD
jgi:hypothetical protein